MLDLFQTPEAGLGLANTCDQSTGAGAAPLPAVGLAGGMGEWGGIPDFLRRCDHCGRLISYGADLVDQYRQATSYVDRIVRDRQVFRCKRRPQYELVVNLKTAKTLGLTVPPMLLARADEVIE
jgi:hypothetical protein